jgi:uncharacterized repeat protein (TIGR04076 family)
MELKPQTVIRMRIVKRNGYCPVFKEGDQIIIKKHCFDTSINNLEKYCYATLYDIYPLYFKMRKQKIGSKEVFKCRDNGIIEIELERLNDELYDYENH